MASIFLSYARHDRACAERLAAILESAGHQVWWDQCLDGGQDFSAQIESALDQAAIVLVAWSKAAIKSRWVRDEAAAGGETGRLVPVSIDGSRPPMGFRQFHTIDLTDWRGAKGDKRTAELLQSVDRRLGASEAAPSAPLEGAKKRFAWPTGRALWATLAALLIVAAGVGVFFLGSRSSPSDPLPKPTIAMVPFTTTSSDAELHDIAKQADEAVSHALAQTGIPVRLLSSLPKDTHSAGDFLLKGELSRNADKIVAIIRLEEAKQGVTILSRRIEGTSKDIRDLPERIGAQTASSFMGPNLMILDRRHPMDPSLMAELLVTSDDQLQVYQIAKRVAAKAPNVPAAQVAVAFSTGFVLGQLPRQGRLEALTEARRAAASALKLAPEFGDTHATWCMLHSDARLAECEDNLRAGSRIDPDAPYLNAFLAILMQNVGRAEEAVELAKLSYAHDPYESFKIGAMLRALEFAGDADGARKLYQVGARWWPEYKFLFFRNRLVGLIYRADFDAMERLEREVGGEILPPDYGKSGSIGAAVRSKSQPALRRACADGKDLLISARCMVAFAALHDLDGAYRIADRLYPNRVGRGPAETERIWLDDPDGGAPLGFFTSQAGAPMRRDARFLKLAQRSGLLAYWRTGRAPDFCKIPEPVCAQLRR